MRFIDKVGVEIEGGWDGTPGESPFEFPLKRELSVPEMDGLPHVGEAATVDPLNLGEVEGWLVKHWPQGFDNRCGMHVHISVKEPSFYSELATKDYFEFCLAELERWGKTEDLPPKHLFWHRLAGKNRFCNRIFDPSSQMKLKTKDGHEERRSVLNYCWDMHKTLECRVFPMFTEGPLMASRAAHAFVMSAENYLTVNEKKFMDPLSLVVSPRMGRKAPAPPEAAPNRPNWGRIERALGEDPLVGRTFRTDIPNRTRN